MTPGKVLFKSNWFATRWMKESPWFLNEGESYDITFPRSLSSDTSFDSEVLPGPAHGKRRQTLAVDNYVHNINRGRMKALT